MPKLLRDLSGRQIIHTLERAGFQFRHQVGSHRILERPRDDAVVSVPDHRRVRPGTLRGIIREAGLTVDEFLRLLKTDPVLARGRLPAWGLPRRVRVAEDSWAP